MITADLVYKNKLKLLKKGLATYTHFYVCLMHAKNDASNDYLTVASFIVSFEAQCNVKQTEKNPQPPGSRRPQIMCLSWNEGQSPIYNNEPLAAWSRCACAVRLGLLQPQTGRPVTRHCTAAAAAHGLTTTTAPGH